MKTNRLFLLSLMLPVLAACGVKGPLVMADGKATPARTVEPIDSPRDADATRDPGAAGAAELADAAEPVVPPTEE
jgi:predicted small lipoprotein YifL